MDAVENELEIPEDIVNFILESEDNDEPEEWRFGNESEEAITLLTQRHISKNTSRKILYVLNLWNEWVKEKIQNCAYLHKVFLPFPLNLYYLTILTNGCPSF